MQHGLSVMSLRPATMRPGSPLSALHPPLKTLRTSFAVSAPVTTIADKQGSLMQVTNDGKTKVQKIVKLDKQ
ncbi:hypothetical protein [Chitinophaga sp. RAB17]|uniref:hypothetical protein n=1 Tax=Chitinophaga sp. RAB17 TaxID=3233049 RepID=UPI003F9127F3